MDIMKRKSEVEETDSKRTKIERVDDTNTNIRFRLKIKHSKKNNLMIIKLNNSTAQQYFTLQSLGSNPRIDAKYWWVYSDRI